jgi:hypothetical protein
MKIEFDKNLNVTEKIPEEGDIAIKTFLGYVWIKYIFIPYIKYILVPSINVKIQILKFIK